MSDSEKSYSGEELRELLWEAWQEGFAQASRGYSPFHPSALHGPDVGEFEDWLSKKGLAVTQ